MTQAMREDAAWKKDGKYTVRDARGHFVCSTNSEEHTSLIAAAPDMLKALKWMVNDSMFKDHPEASQAAINAITKAEGREP